MHKNIPLSTYLLIRSWGKWGAIHIGYPRMSPMFGEHTLKTPLHAVGYIPPDIMDIERAVGMIEPPERQLVIHKHQWGMSLAEIGRELSCSKWIARRRVENAEYSVHVAYGLLGTKVLKNAVIEKPPLRSPHGF